MSLTSYRAAPPRDKPLRAFKKTIPKRIWHNAGRRRSIRSGGFLRRLPLADAMGASGMYQREPALERPVGDLLSFLWWLKGAFVAPGRPNRPLVPESRQTASLEPGSGNLKGTVIPGWSEGPDPESRDSGSGANAPSRNDESRHHVSRNPPSTVTTLPVM